MTKTRKSVAPYYGVAVTWILYAALFDLYRPWQFALAAVLSAAIFLLLQAVCKDQAAEEATSQPQPAAKQEETTGNAELDKMMQDGQKAVGEMKRLNGSIKDPKLSAQIDRLEAVSRAIFDQVKQDPKKLPQIRKFMDYYLPTTLKLLNAYDRMDSTGVSGENIDATKEKVEKMMTTIVAAFEKQLDSLFGSDALDISTDIAVLENMMAREGLTGETMEPETTHNADGTDIKLEL